MQSGYKEIFGIKELWSGSEESSFGVPACWDTRWIKSTELEVAE
jgi:hypothetical protein